MLDNQYFFFEFLLAGASIHVEYSPHGESGKPPGHGVNSLLIVSMDNYTCKWTILQVKNLFQRWCLLQKIISLLKYQRMLLRSIYFFRLALLGCFIPKTSSLIVVFGVPVRSKINCWIWLFWSNSYSGCFFSFPLEWSYVYHHYFCFLNRKVCRNLQVQILLKG